MTNSCGGAVPPDPWPAVLFFFCPLLLCHHYLVYQQHARAVVVTAWEPPRAVIGYATRTPVALIARTGLRVVTRGHRKTCRFQKLSHPLESFKGGLKCSFKTIDLLQIHQGHFLHFCLHQVLSVFNFFLWCSAYRKMEGCKGHHFFFSVMMEM